MPQPSTSVSLVLAGSVTAWCHFMPVALAQSTIVPDATLGAEGSVVNTVGPNSLITGGATRGQNLFHSFEQFDVATGGGAFFVGGADTTNIFSRVTGTDPSDIFGTLGTLGTAANLYFINPNGIVFGPGAVLDVVGSFTATSASGVLFGEAGAFSAVDPQVPSALLTVDPSAYFFSQLNPGEISLTSGLLRSAVLQVPDGENLTLLGGDVVIDGGGVVADGGRIELGAVAGSGVVGLNGDGSLSFPDDLERANVTVTNQALISSVAPDRGAITITANDVAVLNSSVVGIGVAGEIGQPPGQAGDLTISAAGNVSVDNQGLITNQVFSGGAGNAGDLQITATNLEVTNGAQLSASTFGQGDAGDVVIEVTDTARFDGVDPSNGNPSFAGSTVGPGDIGSGGNLQITATNLEVTNGAQLSSSTSGEGDGGDVIIAVTDTARFDGVDPFGGISVSFAGSAVEPGGIGSGGSLQITATNLEVTNGAQLSSSTSGEGDAGDVVIVVADTARFDGVDPFNGSPSFAGSQVGPGGIGSGGNLQITATNLEVTNGAQLNASTFGEGNAGDVVIVVADTARFDGVDPFGGIGTSFAGSEVAPGGIGSGGSLQITAANLEVTNGAILSASTYGEGDAGDVVIVVADTARFDGVDPLDGSRPSFVGSEVGAEGMGNGGSLQITATNLEVTNGAQLGASTFGEGDAGDVVIAVSDTARFDGVNPFGGISASFAGSRVEPGGIGSGGSLQISATNLEVTNGAQLSASTFGEGDAGDVVILVSDTARFDGVNPFGGINPSAAGSQVELEGIGNGGNLQITATNLEVTNGAQLDASTSGEGDAGDVVIVVTDTARFDGVNSFDGSPTGVFSRSSFFSNGSGGDIQITATNLSVTNGAGLSASSSNSEAAGNIQLVVGDRLYMNNGTIETVALRASGGQIDINAASLLLEGDSDIQTFVASGPSGGGNITLTADLILAFDDSDILAFSADGTGGNILLQTPAFFGQNFTPASLTADPATLDGNDRVDINATGAVSGLVSLPNTSLVENSLANLPDVIVNADQLLAGSCIARADKDQGSFVVTGGGGLPARPGDGSISSYPTGQVQATTDAEDQAVWHPSDPIAEPTGVFQLADGRLVLSQDCE